MITSPPVSVVMPVRNALPFLDESVESILKQTFADFEFVILDDASTDGSTRALQAWAQRDARIRLFEVRRNLGLSGSSNFVVEQARAPVIARMDADDISHPERLRKQLAILRSHPDVALVGTLYEGINAEGRRVRPRDRWRLARRSVFPPFPHGSAMFRRNIFEEIGGYRQACAGWEDQDLFLRIREHSRVVTLSETLYSYRFQVNSVTGGVLPHHGAQVIGLRNRCLRELKRGRDYKWLFSEVEKDGTQFHSLADALYLRGSMRLWAGHRPEILSPLFRHKPFGISRRSLMTLVWATWAAVNPAGLRLFLRSIIHARDFLASYRVKDGGVYEWRLK